MRSLLNRIILLIGVLAGIMFIYQFFLQEYITLAIIKENAALLKHLVQEHYWLTVIGFINLYIIIAILALPLASLLTLVAGFLFGVLPAVIYVNIGATIGAIGSFIVFRTMIGTLVQERYAKQLAQFNAAIAQHGVSYLMLVRFIPVIPFFMVNLLASCTKIPLPTFIWTTIIGVIPVSIVYAFTGQQLASFSSLSDVFSPSVLLAFLMLTVLALSPIFLKRLAA